MKALPKLKSMIVAMSLGLALTANSVSAGALNIPRANGSVNVSLQSLTESQFDGVVQQYYDFSCGSAAVATLLTYHYEDPVAEQEVFEFMWERGDKKKIQTLGFSMLDMKRYLDSKGLQADGFKIPLDKFANYNVPAIALINTNGYKHFVVIKGLTDGRVLIGDPALGMRMIEAKEFIDQWAGIVFLIRSKANVGRYYFNQSEEWGTMASVPHEEGVRNNARDLSDFSISLPRPGDF